MNKLELEALVKALEHNINCLNEEIDALVARIDQLEGIEDTEDLDPVELALEESGYEDSEAEAFIEGYMRAEEDLTEEE